MLSHDRQALVLEQLREKGSMKVSELLAILGVSRVTMLRDIDALVEAGHAERFHGGVALAEPGGGPRGRRSGKPLRFGVLLPDGGYFREVLAGITEATEQIGAQQSLALSQYNYDRDLAAIRSLAEDKVDGLLLVGPGDEHGHAPFAEELRALSVPVVLIERRLNTDTLIDRFDHVISDHEAGGRLAVEHLAQLGHRRIALVIRDVSPTKNRVRAGYEHAMRSLGLGPDLPVFEVPVLGRTANGVDQKLTDAVAALRRDRLTAVLVHGDPEAVLLCRLAQAAGLRIPQDLAVVSYDDEVAAFAGVPMTAIAPAKRRIGSAAVNLLAERIREGEQCPVTHIALQPRLVIRESCGARVRTRRAAGPRRTTQS